MKYRLTLSNGDYKYEIGAEYVKGYIKKFGNVIRVQRLYADGSVADVTNKYL